MNSKNPITQGAMVFFTTLLFPFAAVAESGKVVFETNFEQSADYLDLGIRAKMLGEVGRNDHSALRLTQRRLTLLSQPVPINPKQNYRLEGAFKAAPGSEGTEIIFGLLFCDSEGKPISNLAVVPVEATKTVLKQDAEINTQSVLLENVAQSWPTEGEFALAFGAQDDYSDIPNPNVYEIASVSQEGDGLKVVFKEPLTEGFLAGTPVRLHQVTDPALIRFKVSEDWEEHSLKIGGQAAAGASHPQLRGKFWPGASSVLIRLGFFDRKSQEQNKEVWVDDIRIIEGGE